ncbi:hypothetical protein [Pantoea sp. BAV 3049]|uniref:hypothetical protein n=1 Tax=Pantoea sp. BAV 3049 TaxID=2654188 RepID=UPI00131C7E1B|nr:hypothetical protein [Pantoea sp. BAV 3049]
MTEELCRTKFEEWLRSKFTPILRRDDKGEYLSIYVEIRWEAWQAAWNTRAEVEKSDG